jgi:thiamine-phosphate pyrophosphorylase
MAANQPLWPREWLMTDERMGAGLWDAIDALPRGVGVVFRHYSLDEGERAALARRVAETCRKRELVLAVAGNVELAREVDASLVHNPAGDAGPLPFSRSAHSRGEADAAWRAGVSLIFLSPIFATRSHPEAAPLPRELARDIVTRSPVPVIALGGVNRERFAELKADGFYGWAGIDAWLDAGPAFTGSTR